MPGYGGGVGADTDGDNADYGEGMGTKGAAASDNSIGMGSESDKDFGHTVEGFRSALAKALGQVTQAQKDTAVEAQEEAANQRARLEAKNLQELDGGAGYMDTDRGLLGPSVDDDRSLEMSQEKDQERDVNKDVDIGIGPESFTDPSKPSSHPSRDTRIGMPFGVGRPTPTDQQENREPVDMYGRVTEFENIDDPERKAAAYEALAQLQKQAMEAQTPLGKALRSIFGMMEYGTIGTIGKAMKAALDKLGFNVDPNIIGQAMAIAHESVTQGPMGPGGVSIGSRNDNFLNEFLRALPAEEPWMKGLSQSQIDYYLNDPDELDWVRNLYKNMNP